MKYTTIALKKKTYMRLLAMQHKLEDCDGSKKSFSDTVDILIEMVNKK